MTKTIKEITEKFNEVTSKEEYYRENYDEEGLPFTEFLGIKELEQVVLVFSDNIDDFAAAFAAFVTCVIRYDICDKGKTYNEFLSEYAEKLVYNTKFEEKDKLTEFLKKFSCAVCQNDYDKIEQLFNNYDYSIISVYLFGYYMYQYCYTYQEKGESDDDIFGKIKLIYKKMNNDLINYTLERGIYSKNYDKYQSTYDESSYFPYCRLRSWHEIYADMIVIYWNMIAQRLKLYKAPIMSLATFIDFLNEATDDRRNEINQLFYCMTEKIRCLYSDNGLNHHHWDNEQILRSDSPMARNLKLHIPIFTPPKFNTMSEFINKDIKLDITHDALVKTQEEKKEIIDDFSHRYKNMKATSLHDVANSLLEMESETLKQHGRTILLEYGIKESLRKEVDILKLYFEDNIEELKKRIQDSIVPKSSKECYSIYDIINNSIKKCMITLVYDGDDEPKAIRAICFKDYDLISILNSFEKDILFKENVDVIRWFSENIAKLDVGISDYWKQIFCKKYSHSDNILSDLLVELIMNDFKYADKKQPITIELTEDDNFIIIKSENTLVKDKTNIPSHKNGIKTQNKLLNVLNRTEHKVDDSIIYSEKDGKFSIEIKLSKKMFEIKKDEEDDEYANML